MKSFFEKSGKNRSPVRNPDNFCRTPEIIFTGLKPDRILLKTKSFLITKFLCSSFRFSNKSFGHIGICCSYF